MNNDFIKKQVLLGGQCYIVCPAIEGEMSEGEMIYDPDNAAMLPYNTSSIKNALEYSEELKSALSGISIGVLHGKMKAAEKEDIIH